jgi:hypothetical protein
MQEGRRSRRFLSLKDRLALYAEEMRKKAARLPLGADRDLLLKKASQAAGASAVGDAADALRAPLAPKA